MITVILLNIVFVFVSGILIIFRTFGTVSADSNISAGITAISQYITPLNAILPIDTIVAILVFELVFESLYFTYKLIKWGYQKVPMIN
jgi:hypothetical protein